MFTGTFSASSHALFCCPGPQIPPSATRPGEGTLLQLEMLDSRCLDGVRDPGRPRAGRGCGATHTGDLGVLCGGGKRTSCSFGEQREGRRAGGLGGCTGSASPPSPARLPRTLPRCLFQSLGPRRSSGIPYGWQCAEPQWVTEGKNSPGHQHVSDVVSSCCCWS